MEKDYFKDRPIEVTQIKHIYVGLHVLICTKEAQKYAKEIDDLTYGIVTRVLTKQNHPRGIKVEVVCPDGVRRVGRCTYIVKQGMALTKQGFKKRDELNKGS